MKPYARLIGIAALAACAGTKTTSPTPDVFNDDFGTLNGAIVEITGEGGFAALASHQLVRHDERSFVTTQRLICSANCPAPLDSASGTLTPAAADSLFNIIWEQRPGSLQDDYGPTKGGADMVSYTIKVTFQGQTKTIRGDDGTLPQTARRIRDAVQDIIAAARK